MTVRRTIGLYDISGQFLPHDAMYRASRRLNHLSWRSSWIILCTLEPGTSVLFYAQSHDLIGSFLACPSDWARYPPTSECSRRYPRQTQSAVWLPGNFTRLADSVQQTVDASKFPTLVAHPIPLTHIDFYQNRIFLWNFHDFIYFFTDIWVSTVSQRKVAALNMWGGTIKTSVDIAYSFNNYNKNVVNGQDVDT